MAPLALRARRKQIGIWLIAVKAPVAWNATEGEQAESRGDPSGFPGG